MNDAAIIITLPELPPTVNHMYRPNGRGGKLLTEEAKAFRWAVLVALCDRGSPRVPDGDLALTLRVVLPDKRRR